MTVNLFGRYWEIKATTPDGEVRKWNDIDFEATVEKTDNKEPNKTELTIFNLNQDSRDYLNTPGIRVELVAGYDDTHGVIASGDIDGLEIAPNDTTWEIKLTLKDGAKTSRNAKIKETFKKGTPQSVIFNKLVTILTTQQVTKTKKSKKKSTKAPNKINVEPFKKGKIDLSSVTGTLNKARVLKGLAIEYLDELCRSFNLRFYVQDNTLHIVKSNLSIVDEAILLNASSGLLNQPATNDEGYTMTSLLRHEFQPGMAINVQSEAITARLIINKMTHTAQTRGDWLTELECSGYTAQ